MTEAKIIASQKYECNKCKFQLYVFEGRPYCSVCGNAFSVNEKIHCIDEVTSTSHTCNACEKKKVKI